jgi:uncharacterized protein YcfJ
MITCIEVNMTFTLKQLSTAAALLAITSAGSIAQAADFEDYARVINVTPQVEQINMPRQDCRTEYETYQRPQERSNSGGIIGGIAGGLLGSQVGGGNGKIAAAAAGRLLALSLATVWTMATMVSKVTRVVRFVNAEPSIAGKPARMAMPSLMSTTAGLTPQSCHMIRVHVCACTFP